MATAPFAALAGGLRERPSRVRGCPGRAGLTRTIAPSPAAPPRGPPGVRPPTVLLMVRRGSAVNPLFRFSPAARAGAPADRDDRLDRGGRAQRLAAFGASA